jgi:DNA-binding beta-propeller fold protein YncE
MNVRKVTVLMTATIALAAVASASATTGHSIHRRTIGFATGTRYFGFHARLGKQRGFAAAFDLRGGLGFGSALVSSAPVGNGPGANALDEATHTLYVASGFNDNGNAVGGNTVSVIDTRRCRADDVSHCKGPWPTITVGNQPSGIAIDEQTDTVYVSNIADNTVSVFNGATCNGQNTSGCGQTPATVPVGSTPLGIFADPANHTIYVPNAGETDVSMIDSATCNATDLAACPTSAPATVDVGGGPQDVEVDQTTHTVYVTTYGALNGWTVFDANTCKATDQSGCATLGYLTGDPIGPNQAEVDTANDTLYTANYDNTVSAFDLHDCDAAHLTGCASTVSGTVVVPPGAGNGFDHVLWLTVDAPLHTVYAVYQKDDALRVINTNLCSGADPSGCGTLNPPEIHTGADPEMVRLDPQTQTLYTANQVDNDVSVIDATRCNAQTASGCRQRAPEIPLGSGGMTVDPAVATAYLTSGANTVSMLDTRDCNAFDPTGCSATPATVTVGTNPDAVAVNPATHTVYVADGGSGSTGTVSVFDDRTCNANHDAGCGAVSSLQVPGGNPDDVAVNPKTDTVYVATITSSGPDLVSVFNGTSCNATNTLGCDQTPATVSVGNSSGIANTSVVMLAVNQATNTIYASNVYDVGPFPPPFLGNTVYVIDGAACDAANMTGCGQTPATVAIAPNPPIGSNPWGIAVDQATDTIYTANIADGETAGTVSVINGAICNGQNTSGCGQIPATAPAGFGTVAIAVDQATNQVYATNTEDTSVTTINGNACNGTTARGCDRTRTRAVVGDYPGSIAVDPTAATGYVADSEGVSVIPLNH